MPTFDEKDFHFQFHWVKTKRKVRAAQNKMY